MVYVLNADRWDKEVVESSSTCVHDNPQSYDTSVAV
jgi:hypothetical protein